MISSRPLIPGGLRRNLYVLALVFVELAFLYMLVATPDAEWWIAPVFGLIVGAFNSLGIIAYHHEERESIPIMIRKLLALHIFYAIVGLALLSLAHTTQEAIPGMYFLAQAAGALLGWTVQQAGRK